MPPCCPGPFQRVASVRVSWSDPENKPPPTSFFEGQGVEAARLQSDLSFDLYDTNTLNNRFRPLARTASAHQSSTQKLNLCACGAAQVLAFVSCTTGRLEVRRRLLGRR